MTAHEWKEGDKVLVEGEVLSPASSELPAEIGVYCEYIQTRGSWFPSEDAVHPFPVAPYPAEVTDKMVEAAYLCWQVAMGSVCEDDKNGLRHILQAALKAAPAQETEICPVGHLDDFCNYVEQSLNSGGYTMHDVGYLRDHIVPFLETLELKEKRVAQEPDRELLFKAIEWGRDNYDMPADYDYKDKVTPVDDFLSTLSPNQEPEPAVNLDNWERPFFGADNNGDVVAFFDPPNAAAFTGRPKSIMGERLYSWNGRFISHDGKPTPPCDPYDIVSILPSATPRTREEG